MIAVASVANDRIVLALVRPPFIGEVMTSIGAVASTTKVTDTGGPMFPCASTVWTLKVWVVPSCRFMKVVPAGLQAATGEPSKVQTKVRFIPVAPNVKVVVAQPIPSSPPPVIEVTRPDWSMVHRMMAGVGSVCVPPAETACTLKLCGPAVRLL